MREPTEMELRVAKAICANEGAIWDRPESGNGMDADEFYAHYYAAARAAIRAMREPTKDMILAGEDAYSDFEDSSRDTHGSWNFVHPGHESATWMAMVDSASPPDSGEG